MIKKCAWIVVLLFCLGLFLYLHQHSDARIHARSRERTGAVEAASDSVGRSPSPAPAGAAQSGATVTIAGAEQQQAGIVVAPIEVRPVARTLTVAEQIGMDEKHTSQVGAIADGRISARLHTKRHASRSPTWRSFSAKSYRRIGPAGNLPSG
jgi:hypothetical protein